MAIIGKCPKCGANLQPDLEHCLKCGAENPAFGMSWDEFIARRGQEVQETKTTETASPPPASGPSATESGQTITEPRTIEELKRYCAEKHMPLERMRFFLDQDYREPRAFGIYRDGDEFVVYKNKADGSRAVRYRGRDEAYAVRELYDKLLEECHQRGIYPDGVRMSGAASHSPSRSYGGGAGRNKSSDSGCLGNLLKLFGFYLLVPLVTLLFRYIVIALPLALGVIVVNSLLKKLVFNDKLLGEIHGALRVAISAVLVIVIALGVRGIFHRNDGYYRLDDGSIRYHYGSQSYDTGKRDPSWTRGSSSGDGIEIYLGDSWDSSWGGTTYYPPTLWDDMESVAIETSSSHSGSSSSSDWDDDWDDWDSSDTDWDSDW